MCPPGVTSFWPEPVRLLFPFSRREEKNAREGIAITFWALRVYRRWKEVLSLWHWVLSIISLQRVISCLGQISTNWLKEFLIWETKARILNRGFSVGRLEVLWKLRSLGLGGCREELARLVGFREESLGFEGGLLQDCWGSQQHHFIEEISKWPWWGWQLRKWLSSAGEILSSFQVASQSLCSNSIFPNGEPGQSPFLTL